MDVAIKLLSLQLLIKVRHNYACVTSCPFTYVYIYPIKKDQYKIRINCKECPKHFMHAISIEFFSVQELELKKDDH